MENIEKISDKDQKEPKNQQVYEFKKEEQLISLNSEIANEGIILNENNKGISEINSSSSLPPKNIESFYIPPQFSDDKLNINNINNINFINDNPNFNFVPHFNEMNDIKDINTNNINVNNNVNFFPNEIKNYNMKNQSQNIEEPKNLDFLINFNNISNNNNNSNNFQLLNTNNKEQIKVIICNLDIILNLLANYKGSIFLQNILLIINKKELSILFTTISPQICNIMCLEYGNYFIQKLIKKLDVQQRLRIYPLIDNNFLNIATDKRGTHAIQALMDTIQTPMEQFFLDKLLNKNMLLLFNNENGYHIIMKIILDKPENQRNNINLFLISNVDKIIINSYGAYCVSKFVINNSNLNLRLLFIKNIQNNIKNLIFNKNSISVIMLSIRSFGINNFEFIIYEIKNNLAFLSLHPVANSFIGKMFYYLKINEYYKLSSIIWDIFRNDNLIKSLCSHKNGNNLLKKIMEYSNNTQKKYIKAKINFIKKK
jgi:hypothetical protein